MPRYSPDESKFFAIRSIAESTNLLNKIVLVFPK